MQNAEEDEARREGDIGRGRSPAAPRRRAARAGANRRAARKTRPCASASDTPATNRKLAAIAWPNSLIGRRIGNVRIDMAEMAEVPAEVKGEHRQHGEAARDIERTSSAARSFDRRRRRRLEFAEHHIRRREIVPRGHMPADPDFRRRRAGKADHRRLLPAYCRAWCARRPARRRSSTASCTSSAARRRAGRPAWRRYRRHRARCGPDRWWRAAARASPPRWKRRVKLRVCGSKTISFSATIGRSCTSTGPIRKDEP